MIQAACTKPTQESLEKIKQESIEKHLKLIADAAAKDVKILCMLWPTDTSSGPSTESGESSRGISGSSTVRQVWQLFRDRRPETYGDLVKT